MPGFPRRFLRSALGPSFTNTNPVENPEQDLDAAAFNALCHQVAGMNLLALRAVYVGEWSGAAMVHRLRAEAWNPEESQAHPAISRTGAGLYSLTFAASYLDETGAPIATALLAPVAWSARVITAFADVVIPSAWVDPIDPLVVRVALYATGGALVDVPFGVGVL